MSLNAHDVNTSNEEKLYDKIRKLLALGESPNEEEASLAVAKAHELLKKHNLSMDKVELQGSEFKEQNYFKMEDLEGWKAGLLKRIAQVNYSDILLRKSTVDSLIMISIIGREHNVVSTKIMADYLFTVAERLSKESYPEDDKLREGYLLGLSNGLQKRLEKLRIVETVSSDSKALVVQSAEDIKNHLEEMGAEESHVDNPELKDQDRLLAFLKGNRDAQKVALSVQLEGGD